MMMVYKQKYHNVVNNHSVEIKPGFYACLKIDTSVQLHFVSNEDVLIRFLLTVAFCKVDYWLQMYCL